MRVAALYDVHANLPALDAVLSEVEHADPELIVCGGDVVWGPMPVETLERLCALGDRVRYVRGNCDREVVEAFDAAPAESDAPKTLPERWTRWVARQLTAEQRDFLAAFEPQVTASVEGLGETLFCHGSPRRDDEVITMVTNDERLASMLGDVDQDVVVCGHTHIQFDRHVRGKRVINAGAVGLPYEGAPGAFWLLLGPDAQLRRTEYDLDAAVAAMTQPGFPQLDELLKESLLEPVPPTEVAELFERGADS
jgi:predicted phosphodiesterase